ncbi:hypothetical protein H0H92_005417, partial [Tricholoma furcatifolium]
SMQSFQSAHASNSTHTRSNNGAYNDLLQAYTEQKVEIRLLRAAINSDEIIHLRQLSSTLASSSKPATTYPNRSESRIHLKSLSARQVSRKNIPKVEDQQDYPDVPYWEHSEWLRWVERQKNRGQKVDRFGFLTDSDGQPLSRERLKEISATSTSCWNEIAEWREQPASWKKKTSKVKDYYYYYMLTEFREFLLADGYWKLEAYATLKYPDWTQGHALASKEHAKARKKGAAPTMAPILTTTSSNVPDAPDVN